MKHSLQYMIPGIILTLIGCNSFAGSALSFDQAWIPEAPPVSKVMAAYMNITNHSDKTIIIDSIVSDDFSRIEFHRTVDENNVAKMLHQKSLSVPASGTLKLEPGGYHMMLFNPARRLQAGNNSVFTIKTSGGQLYETTIPVKKSQMDHSHHHH